MAVLLIRAGAQDHEPPETMLVLESEVAEYLAKRWVRVGIDPGRLPLKTRPPWWKTEGTE